MDLELTEKEHLKAFLVEVYGFQARSWQANTKMFDLTYKLLESSGECSDLMDMVPRPMPLGASPQKWLTKQVRGLLLRQLKERKEHYAVCVHASSVKLKPRFLMAGNGI